MVENAGLRRKVLVECSTISVTAPKIQSANGAVLEKPNFDSKSITSPDIVAERIKDGKLEVSSAYIFDANQSILSASLYLRDRSNPPAYPLSSSRDIALDDDYEYFFPLNAGWRNYFHWLLQVSFSCYLMVRFLEGMHFRILLSELTDTQREILESLSIGADQVKIVQENATVNFANVWTLNTSYGSFANQPSSLLFDMGAAIKDKLPAGPSPRRFYISRRDSGKRSIVNEEEVEALLIKLGLKVIILSNMSFKDQVNLFSNADLIVAPHGAGLANIIFSRPGTRVIELCSSHYVNYCFARLAQVGHLDHEMHVFRSEDDKNRHKVRWSIDVEYVAQLFISGRLGEC